MIVILLIAGMHHAASEIVRRTRPFSAAINCKLSCLLCAYYGVLDFWGTKPLME